MPQKLCCEVVEKINHGEQVYSLVLRPDRPLPRFLAGQFLHLALDEYHPGDFWPDSRAFSIASAPAERDHLRITYAVKGVFTSRMQAEITTGRSVWVKLPYGEFTIDAGYDVCLLAGGTGISAFTGFISAIPADYPNRVVLCYGARRPGLLIYRTLVEEAASRCPNLQVFYFTEEKNTEPGYICGRIDLEKVWGRLPNPPGFHYYLSGPPEMLHALTGALIQRDISAGLIHIDAWE
jgi:ferredoxin-NADP reductase